MGDLWSDDVLKPGCADATLLNLRVGPPFFWSSQRSLASCMEWCSYNINIRAFCHIQLFLRELMPTFSLKWRLWNTHAAQLLNGSTILLALCFNGVKGRNVAVQCPVTGGAGLVSVRLYGGVAVTATARPICARKQRC